MEKYLLQPPFFLHKLHVVHHQNVATRVFFTEITIRILVGRILVQRSEIVVAYFFRRGVYHGKGRIVFKKIIPDRVQKVRFSESHAAVYIQRIQREKIIVGTGIFRDGLRRSGCKTVIVGDYEIFKRVFLHERIFPFGGRKRSFNLRHDRLFLSLDLAFRLKEEIRDGKVQVDGDLGKTRAVVHFQRVRRVLRRRDKSHHVVVYFIRNERIDPKDVFRRAQFRRQFEFNLLADIVKFGLFFHT